MPSEHFDAQYRENFSATCILEKEKKKICLTSYNLKSKSKGTKIVIALSTPRPLHGKTTDDVKEKPQIIKFNDFTKGVTDIEDQLNDYFITRSKSFR